MKDASPASTDDSAAQLQERLAAWGKVATLVSLGLLVVLPLLTAVAPPPLPLPEAWEAAAHLATTLLFALIWRLAAGRRRSLRFLERLDALGTIAAAVGITTVDALTPPPLRPELTTVIAVAYLLVSRAAIVPSTARRTAIIGGLCALPPLIMTALRYAVAAGAGGAAGGVALPSALHAAAFVGIWQALGTVTAAVISAIIYGLRAEVRMARRLGQYTIEEKLGEGGVGAVYKARHALLRRPTAIKLLRPEHSNRAELVRRFEREVQLSSQLTHPSTVAVYDFGRTPDGTFYYVMEYLDGINLAALVERDGPQPPGRVVRLLLQACRALAEAHDVGLIHRDIKPANLIVCHRGGEPDVVKVVDFGLVKDLTVGATDVSAEGTVVGTPRYLAPEAITAPQAVDARADIYGLGAVAYYLLSGRDAFVSESLPQLLVEITSEPPPPPSKRLGRPLPEALERLVLRCLDKDPAARPQRARDLAHALEQLADVPPWTEAAATAWWQANEGRRRVSAARTAAAAAEGQGTVVIDWASRGVA